MKDLDRLLRSARRRVARCEQKIERYGTEIALIEREKAEKRLLDTIGIDGPSAELLLLNEREMMQQLGLADATRALELARAEVSRLEAELARQEDSLVADKLESWAAMLDGAAEDIDAAIVALRKACEHHREIQEGIARLCPDLAKALLAPHMPHRFPMRQAVIFHGLARYLPIDGVRHAAAPFASVRPLCIERRVAELRNGEKDEAA